MDYVSSFKEKKSDNLSNLQYRLLLTSGLWNSGLYEESTEMMEELKEDSIRLLKSDMAIVACNQLMKAYINLDGFKPGSRALKVHKTWHEQIEIHKSEFEYSSLGMKLTDAIVNNRSVTMKELDPNDILSSKEHCKSYKSLRSFHYCKELVSLFKQDIQMQCEASKNTLDFILNNTELTNPFHVFIKELEYLKLAVVLKKELPSQYKKNALNRFDSLEWSALGIEWTSLNREDMNTNAFAAIEILLYIHQTPPSKPIEIFNKFKSPIINFDFTGSFSLTLYFTQLAYGLYFEIKDTIKLLDLELEYKCEKHSPSSTIDIFVINGLVLAQNKDWKFLLSKSRSYARRKEFKGNTLFRKSANLFIRLSNIGTNEKASRSKESKIWQQFQSDIEGEYLSLNLGSYFGLRKYISKKATDISFQAALK